LYEGKTKRDKQGATLKEKETVKRRPPWRDTEVKPGGKEFNGIVQQRRLALVGRKLFREEKVKKKKSLREKTGGQGLLAGQVISRSQVKKKPGKHKMLQTKFPGSDHQKKQVK